MDDLIEQINDSWDINREKADDNYWKEVDSCAAFCDTIDETSELSADILGIQEIKYDSETPYDNAINYKNEGNYYFKKKNYVLAIANYRKAISLKIDDNNLNGILHSNLAACLFYQENYRKCIDNCKKAINLNKDYIKAYWRAGSAAEKVNKIDEALSYCDKVLEFCIDNKDINDLRERLLEKKKKEAEKGMCLVSKPLMVIEELIKSRGIVIDDEIPTIEIPRQHLCQPFVDSDKNIHFNVLILYPEYGQTDYLQDVVETASLMDCLSTIFTASEKTVDWDLKGHYRLYNSAMKLALQAYYRSSRGDMIQVDLKTSVKALILSNGYKMRPDLVIEVSVVSNMSRDFLDRWNKDSMALNLD